MRRSYLDSAPFSREEGGPRHDRTMHARALSEEPMASASERIIVVGASAGGVRALPILASQLTPEFPAVVLVVQHIGSHPSILPTLLMRDGPLSAAHAVDGEPIEAGRIYLPPPHHPILLRGGGGGGGGPGGGGGGGGRRPPPPRPSWCTKTRSCLAREISWSPSRRSANPPPSSAPTARARSGRSRARSPRAFAAIPAMPIR